MISDELKAIGSWAPEGEAVSMPARVGSTSVTKEIVFDTGHRLLGYDGKCAHLHGHTYRCFITLSAMEMSEEGFVEDFGVIKDLCESWIDDYLDHAFILNMKDPLVSVLKKEGEERIFTMEGNPTAENMAFMLYTVFVKLLSDHYISREAKRVIRLDSVRVYETPTSCAEYPIVVLSEFGALHGLVCSQ